MTMGRCCQCGRTDPHRITELWCDPTSGELSVSRLAFFVITFVYLPILIVMAAYKLIDIGEIVKMYLGINSAPTLVYGFNSAIGALKGGRDTDAPADPGAGGSGGTTI